MFRNRIRRRMEEFDQTGFINGNHANEALQRMDQFLRNKQLCDVTLIGMFPVLITFYIQSDI